MNKTEFINKVHQAAGGNLSKKDTAAAVQAVFDSMGDALKEGGRFSYPGFGTFNVKERGARQGRNPRTGEAIEISASKSVSFKPAPGLKDNI